MFRMLGNKVELIRCKVIYNSKGEEHVENCVSTEHRNEITQKLEDRDIEFAVETIDQTSNEWFNGLEFGSYDEAKRVFEAGEAQFNLEKDRKELTDSLRLRSDIDYIAIMSGVEI